jgi:energy-coupling factor transporter ATP-binding protein EcfA2
MNLKSLNIINFGIFRNLKLAFGPGLNLIFGPNESGKTTIVDAIVLGLLSRSSKKTGVLKGIPRFVKDRYGSEISLQIVAEHDAEELTFPAPENFQDRWGVGWDELRAIFISREGDLELAKGDPREFQQWWDGLKGKLLGFEEEPKQVLKKIAAEAGLTEKLGLKVDQQRRITDIHEKLGWYRGNEERVRSQRTLEISHRDLQLERERLTQEVKRAKNGLRKAKLIRAKEIYQQMKAAQVELREKHGRYAEADLSEWKSLHEELKKEEALLDQLHKQRDREEQKHKETETEATQFIKQAGILGAKLGRAVGKEAELDEAVRREEMGHYRGVPVWAPWMSWALAALSLILGLALTASLLAIGGILVVAAICLTYFFHRGTRKREQLRREQEMFLRWGREIGLETSSLGELQEKIEDLRQKKAQLEGQQAQLQDHLSKTMNDLKSFTEQEKAKLEVTEKIRSKIRDLREKVGLSDLEELQNLVKSKKELESNVEKKYKSELRVLLGPDEASWPDQLEDLKALEDVQPLKDERTVDQLSKALEKRRNQQAATYQELTELKENIKAEFKVQKPEEVIWKVDDLRQELRELEILRRAGKKVNQIFERLLQRSDTILGEIIGGETVCEGFQRVTGGKYRTVTMENLALRVTDARGQQWDFPSLSTGTKDQLLTVLRLALAEKRLRGKGFLIFDEALVTSDRARLREQMEMLGRLTQEGWQILFMTAQDEVRQEAERLEGQGVDVQLLDL